jgi:hypothetical protein
MKKNNSLINLDNSAGVILLKSKAELQETAKSLKSNLDKLTEYEALYKLQFLIKERLDYLKDDAKNTFIEKFSGSQTEKENGFTITLKSVNKIIYRDDIQELIEDIEIKQDKLKKLKEQPNAILERKNIGDSLTLTLK